jgi:hypothetical protein
MTVPTDFYCFNVFFALLVSGLFYAIDVNL